jgi:hypothetical protein
MRCFHGRHLIIKNENVQLLYSQAVNILIYMSRDPEKMTAQVKIAESYLAAAKDFSETAFKVSPLMFDWGNRLAIQDVLFIEEHSVDRMNRAIYHLKETLRLLKEETAVMDA